MLMNLYNATVNTLHRNDKKVSDALWVSDGEKWFTFDEFSKLAKSIDYDSGYGHPEINLNLVVVGDDWWLERNEYDGEEWWEFKTLPKKPEENDVPKIKGGW